MKRHRIAWCLVLSLLALAALLGAACDKYTGTETANQPPVVFISSGPLEGDSNTSYKVHFYWHGHDPDGKIDHFEYVITDDAVTGSLLIDENVYQTIEDLGYEWTNIEVHDSIFIVSADSIPSESNPDDQEYLYNDEGGHFLFRAQHTFFIRAVDEDETESKIPAHRTFTATTIAPEVKIVHPADTGGVGGYDNMPLDIFFRWSGNDSVGDGTVLAQAESTRYALLKRGDLGLDQQSGGRMLDFPDSIWSVWRQWDAVDSLNPNLSGTKALVQGLIPYEEYLFLVQARDEAGAITSHYEDGKNLRKLRAISALQPGIRVFEKSLGLRVSYSNQSFDFTIAEGQPLDLEWQGFADFYGSEITGFRYGWDILDTDIDEEWSNWSPSNTRSAKPDGFVGGTHAFYVEARDYSGTRTRIIFNFFVVPFSMEEDLLFIDDYDNTNSDDPESGWPNGEGQSWQVYPHNNQEQKDWWDAILGEYPSYFPGRDFYRVNSADDKPPFERVANYKRLIWEVQEIHDAVSGLAAVTRFVDPYVSQTVPYDFLSAFLDRGGQLLLCGYNPVYSMLPSGFEMGIEDYVRRTPMVFLKHLRYSQGSPSESVAAAQRFLPWRFFGIDAVATAANANPKLFGANTSQKDFKTFRNFWGCIGFGFTGESFDRFGNAQGWVPGDTLKLRPRVYQWLEEAGYEFSDPDRWNDPNCPGESEDELKECHHEFGLAGVEVYNWDWFQTIFEPPLVYRTDQYVPLLTYVPADSTTRWGRAPTTSHPFLTLDGDHFNELRYSTGGQGKHVVGVVSLQNPNAPNVLLGFVPYYLEDRTGKALIDHILLDIFGMHK